GDRDGLPPWALHRPDPPAAPFRSTDSSPDVGWRRAWRGRLAPRTDRLRKLTLDRAGSSRRAARANPQRTSERIQLQQHQSAQHLGGGGGSGEGSAYLAPVERHGGYPFRT